MRFLLLLCGGLPLALGLLENRFMTVHPDILLPYKLLGILFLLLWGLIAFLGGKRTSNSKSCVAALNLLPLAVLLLLGLQELVLKAYWPNVIGLWTQLFYLPLIPIGFVLTRWSHVVFSAYCASFLLLLAASAAGCKLRQRLGK